MTIFLNTLHALPKASADTPLDSTPHITPRLTPRITPKRQSPTRSIVLAVLLTPMLAFTNAATADTVRDCVMEGTVKRQQTGSVSDNVYVAFHSAKPADKDASCRIRKREKLQFKAPGEDALDEMAPGTRVQYRYTEDSKDGATWKLQNVSD